MASQDDPLPVEYLTTARLGEKGQLTIPKAYRDAFELEVGAPIAVLQLGTSLVLIPEQARFQELCDRLVSRFLSQGIEAQELLATLPDAREEVFARHYPELVEQQSARQGAKRS
ncbi:hypothetical protein C2W62_11580 [Candidatus Entotheonella serta]|nr:hypothetical protein C2W62_11580 [Candidatus Entotheonella serta]